MRFYTIHTRPWSASADADAIAIKEGFSWPAALFTVLWALWHGLWLEALGLLAVELVLSAAVMLVGLDALSAAVIGIAWRLILGFVGNDLWRRTLSRRGYVEAAVVTGPDRMAAEHRYLASEGAGVFAR